MFKVQRMKGYLGLFVFLFLAYTAVTSMAASDNKKQNYPFILEKDLPAKKVVEQKYMKVKHDLSPLADYHFTIIKNKNWGTVNVRLNQAPTKVGEVGEIAVFRPKEKMEAEIVITAHGVEHGASLLSSDWLEGVIQNTYKEKQLEILGTRNIKAGNDIIRDSLIYYVLGGKKYVSRLYAWRKNAGVMILVQGTAEALVYPKVAEEFYFAMTLEFL